MYRERETHTLRFSYIYIITIYIYVYLKKKNIHPRDGLSLEFSSRVPWTNGRVVLKKTWVFLSKLWKLWPYAIPLYWLRSIPIMGSFISIKPATCWSTIAKQPSFINLAPISIVAPYNGWCTGNPTNISFNRSTHFTKWHQRYQRSPGDRTRPHHPPGHPSSAA